MAECLVCQMPNTGHHFGVSCCRACAAFFRRTIQLNLRYQCRFNGNCDVSKKNRYSCRSCRLRRCLSLGMGKDISSAMEIDPGPSNYLELVLQANFFKQNEFQQIFDPPDIPSIPSLRSLQEMSPMYQLEVMLEPQNTNSYHANIIKMIKSQLDDIFEQTSQPEFPFGIPLSLCQQAMLAYAKHNEQWPNCTPDKLIHTSAVDLSLFLRANYAEIEHVAKFCMSVQPFPELPSLQKWLVFKHFWPRFVELDRTFVSCKLLGYDLDDDRLVSFDGNVINFSCNVSRLEELTDLTEKQLRRLLQCTQDVFKDAFSTPFKKFKPDDYELIYMIMSMMWNVKDLEDISHDTILIADNVCNRLSEDLFNYYAFEKKCGNYASRLYKLNHLVTALDRISELRKEDSHMSKTFNIFKHDIYLNELK